MPVGVAVGRDPIFFEREPVFRPLCHHYSNEPIQYNRIGSREKILFFSSFFCRRCEKTCRDKKKMYNIIQTSGIVNKRCAIMRPENGCGQIGAQSNSCFPVSEKAWICLAFPDCTQKKAFFVLGKDEVISSTLISSSRKASGIPGAFSVFPGLCPWLRPRPRRGNFFQKAPQLPTKFKIYFPFILAFGGEMVYNIN